MALRGPGSLLLESFRFYKTHFESLIGIMIVPAILSALSSYLEIAADPKGDGGMLVRGMLGELAAFGPILSLVVIIISTVVSIIAYIALTLFVADPSRYPSVSGLYGEAKRYFFPYLWIGILNGLAVFAGMILFIIPGIIVAIWFIFSGYTLVLEDKRGTQALKASKALVKGRWWAVFGRSVVIGLVFGIPFIIIYLALVFIVPDLAIATAIFNIVSTLVIPIGLAYSYFLYKDARASADTAPVPLSENPSS